MKRRFKQVDVFTTRPFRGNPVAVVLECEGLDDAEMQAIARWTNLSETSFVLPPGDARADYRLRIFTPQAELPFAGHPTVGSAHAVLEAGLVGTGKTSLVQECQAGLLPLSVQHSGEERRIFVTVPEPKLHALADEHHAALARGLGRSWVAETPPRIVDVGAVWIIAQLEDDAAVAGLKPDLSEIARLSEAVHAGGVTVFGRIHRGIDPIKVRSFAPAHGVAEDPVCGSGNACVGAYVAHHEEMADLLPFYSASQGRELGRDGRVFVHASRKSVRIGGPSVTCIDGTLDT